MIDDPRQTQRRSDARTHAEMPPSAALDDEDAIAAEPEDAPELLDALPEEETPEGIALDDLPDDLVRDQDMEALIADEKVPRAGVRDL